MAKRIPELRIGSSMEELKKFVVNHYKYLDEKTKTSIFNFIKDEEEIGDAKISNQGEMQMLINFLRGNDDMPESDLPSDVTEYSETIHWPLGDKKIHSEGHPILGGKFIEQITSNRSSREEDRYINISYEETGFLSSISDTYIDNKFDGTLDSRVYRERGLFEPDTSYIDENLDGKFETKVVRDKKVGDIIYYRDENNNWIEKESK